MAKEKNLTLVELARSQKTLDDSARLQCDKHRVLGESYTNYNANLNDELAIVFLGFVKAERGYEYGYKNFPLYRLVYTVGGQATLTTPKGIFTMKSGTICGFSPNNSDIISVNSDTTWDHYFLHFTGKNASQLYKQTKLDTHRVIRTSNPPRIHQYFEDMLESESNKLEFAHICNVNLLRVLLMKLANDAYVDTEDYSLVSRESYLQCRSYINSHFSELKSFQELADSCNISKSHICYLFKQFANTSPMAYVMKLKMNKAAIMLLQTYFSIKQISRMLGFDDQYYFSRLFKRHYGISPKFYRKKNN